MTDHFIAPDDSESARYTVVIPVRNGADYVEVALKSALSQSTKDLKILVSDNGSTDATPAILEKYSNINRVQVIRQTDDLSMLEHFNRCITLVDTEFYMVLCHDDALASPDAVAEAIAAADADPALSAVYCDLEYIDQHGERISFRRFGRSGQVDGPSIGHKAILTMRNQFGIPLLVRTRHRGEHLYDERLPYAADVEMSLYLARQGATHYLPRPHIANRYHASNSTRGLMANSRREMEEIARTYSVKLGPATRVMMWASGLSVSFAKAGFFKFLLLRSALRRA
jgi:glycosyltransferase involved in cell wall biosynthesis